MREKLKKEICELEETYKNTRLTLHPDKSLDEIILTFKLDDGGKHKIICNIGDYPNGRPLWFSDSENDLVAQVLQNVDSDVRINELKQMVKFIFQKLCDFFNQSNSLNSRLSNAANDLNGTDVVVISSDDDEDRDEEGDEGDGDEEGDVEDLDAVLEQVAPRNPNEEGIPPEKLQKLEKIRLKQRPNQTSSIQATDRLMKEITQIYKSNNYKDGNYSIEIINDDVYNWKVSLLKVDPDSELAKDLAKETKKQIDLSLKFAANFPFEPPFVRVIAPVISRGYVQPGGAICMELLTKDGWSSAYSIESLIMQIGATLIKGKARINTARKAEVVYSANRALSDFHHIQSIHRNGRWRSQPKSEG
jgi:ubiquitin-conjugating enzyme E2 Q